MLISGKCSGEVITPFTDVVMALEGERVTLSFNYSGTSLSLFWYLQNPRSAPQFLTSDHMNNKPGFSVKHEREKKHVHLEISSAKVTDSALYYCALVPTVIGSPDTLYKNPDIVRGEGPHMSHSQYHLVERLRGKTHAAVSVKMETSLRVLIVIITTGTHDVNICCGIITINTVK